MGHQTEVRQLLEHEADIIEREEISPLPCKSCGTLTEHARNLNNLCPSCFVKDGLTIRREYEEAEKPIPGHPMGNPALGD